MLAKLEAISKRWRDIQEKINDPDVMSDMKKYIKLSKDYKELEPIVKAHNKYSKLLNDLKSAREILHSEKDEEMRELAKSEITELSEKKNLMEEEIRIMLIPKDPQDKKNAIVEIRAGTGGDEASIFAGDLFRMYNKYCETEGWKTETIDVNEGTMGGFKEIIFEVKGNEVYGRLKYESGVHRVQRVPKTEAQGRIHTSAASVVVLPEADEIDVEIAQSDLRIDRFCSSGPGGQSVNTTYSAVRITHIPTGIVATCQDEKSQIKNLEKAMAVLRTRLYELEYKKQLEEVSSKRKTMVSTGDRSAKIRTYNWPQGRVTDHRINLTLYNLQSIIDGNIHELIDQLQLAENAERLKEDL
ncbi:MAG: peptide chain release factor 1 [Bacteroidales bacterium]|nr:peptide chain release factor 1 [Bacteroidales bacterium]